MIDPNLVVGAGKEIAKLLNQLIDEKKIGRKNAIFKFKAKFEEEKKRPDRDHDDLIKWSQTQRLFLNTVLEEVRPSSS